MGFLCGLAAWVVKFMLFAANVLFMLTGIAILVMGVLIQKGFQTYDSILHGAFSGTAISIIVVGSLIVIIGFAGCCGAICKSVCLLNIYAVLLIGVFIAEVTIGIIALNQVGLIKNFMTNNFSKVFVDEYKNPPHRSTAFDSLHEKFSCCAVTGPNDFNTLFVAPIPVPESCRCPTGDLMNADKCVGGFFRNGCTAKFTTWIEEGVRTVGILCLSVAAVEIVAIVVACCLASRFKKHETV